MTDSALKRRLREDLNVARKSRDRARTLLLTTLLSDVHNREIELGHDLSDEEAVEVIQRAVRRRHEAAEMMKSRPERAEQELWEARTLETYLPERLSDEEIRARIREVVAAGATSLGSVMGQIMPKLKGRADAKRVNEIAQEELRAAGRSSGGGS